MDVFPGPVEPLAGPFQVMRFQTRCHDPPDILRNRGCATEETHNLVATGFTQHVCVLRRGAYGFNGDFVPKPIVALADKISAGEWDVSQGFQRHGGALRPRAKGGPALYTIFFVEYTRMDLRTVCD